MTVIHLKKRDVMKSKVRGVDMEFDHEKLATILGVPGKNGICEYIKEVWEESKYTKPLEITRRFANDDTIMEARRVKEAVIDEATVEGESGSDDQFYDAQVEVEEPVIETPADTSDPDFIFDFDRKIKNLQESTPRAPLADFQKLNF
ncbi:hypothetical protein Dimus_028805 [Dionaea muscipula]